jgi:hypothetical protein
VLSGLVGNQVGNQVGNLEDSRVGSSPQAFRIRQ